MTTKSTDGQVKTSPTVTELQSTVKEQKKELRALEKQLAAATAERHAALEEAQALTHLGSWQWEIATNVISWSDELYRLYGLRPQERAIGFEEFIGLIHPEDQERVQGIIGTAFASSQPFQFEHRIILPNENLRILYGMGKVITDSKGQPVRMVGTSQDITERKKTEEALHRSDDRFRAIMQATHDLVYDLDLQAGTIWFNESLSTEYGYDKKYMNASLEWWIDRIHPDDAMDIELEISNLLFSSEQIWDAEYRFQKSDGTYTTVRNRAVILRDGGGEPLRIVGSLLDITKQKQLDKAKDEFISLVSHQLRTPLTTIRLLSEMLTGGFVGNITKEQKVHTQKITNASIRLIKLVGDILNISRIELDRIAVKPRPTDVNELIHMHIEELSPLADEQNIHVEFKPGKDIELLPLDPSVFGEIVHNLVANAIHYTIKGKGRVVISFVQKKDSYLLTVADNGIGIPASAQDRIFERFFRAENTNQVEGEGTGLGLYLVKLIVDAFGGKIWFKSNIGKGTTFYVRIPLAGMHAHAGDVNYTNT